MYVLNVNRNLLTWVVPLVCCYEHISERFVYLKEEISWLSEHQLSTKTVLHTVSNLMIICVYVCLKIGIIFIKCSLCDNIIQLQANLKRIKMEMKIKPLFRCYHIIYTDKNLKRRPKNLLRPSSIFVLEF